MPAALFLSSGNLIADRAMTSVATCNCAAILPPLRT
jgi:hypothetical protein